MTEIKSDFLDFMTNLESIISCDITNNDPYVWRKRLRKIGNNSIDLPSKYGGSDFSNLEMLKIFEKLGSVDLELRDVPGAGHARMLLNCDSEYSENLIRKVSKGTAYVGIAITEENAGSDIRAIRTEARLVNGEYVISGEKCYVARIQHASDFIVFARLTTPNNADEISAFVVPTSLCETSNLVGMGHRAFSWGKLAFSNVRIPYSARIFAKHNVEDIFSAHFSYWRLMISAAAIGCARTAIDDAIKHLSKRKAFGMLTGEMTHLQNELAIHVASVHSAWLLCIWAANRADVHGAHCGTSAMVKAESVERGILAVEWVMKVFGARGYSMELDIEKRYRDLAGLRIADGSTDVLRCSAARSMLRPTASSLGGLKQKNDFTAMRMM